MAHAIGSAEWLRERFPDKDWHRHRRADGRFDICDGTPSDCSSKQRLSLDESIEFVTPEDLARYFHEEYERMAPSFGYATREASAKPWLEVPENNRHLMMAVSASVLMRFFPDRMAIAHDERGSMSTSGEGR